ncbi:MAG TPA: class I SAM-dependent methyltransferase [Candidatus Binatia bacterium]|jgi:SAM-dependent methyltransferase
MAYAVVSMFVHHGLTPYESVMHSVAMRWHAAQALMGLSIAITLAEITRKLKNGLIRLSEIFFEWRYGIVSDGEIAGTELGFTENACHDYQATNYVRFRQLMKHIAVRQDTDVFLDFGSGMGRAVILAATYPFRKVIGVELAIDLHKRASENVRRAAKRLRCRDIELYNVDARRFRIPPEVTVIYMWNPFAGEVLREVFTNIQKSIAEYPRLVTILYLAPMNPTALDAIKDGLPWLNEKRRTRLGPQSLAVFYTCGVAEAAAALPNALSALAQIT